MPFEWALSIVVPSFEGNCDIRRCSCYRVVIVLELGMKMVEMVMGKRLHVIVYVNEMQFDFMHVKESIDTVSILRRLQEEYHARGRKLCMCFVDLDKAFDSVPRKVLECAMKKK